jgi:hypothetical protein
LPYPADYRPAFAFSGILCPLAHPPSSRSGYHPKMGTMGFTQLIEIDTYRGEVGLYSPVERTGAATGRDRSGGPLHIAFWLRPVSLFGRFGVTTNESSRAFNLPRSPWPRPALRLAGLPTLSLELHTLGYPAACPGRGTLAPKGPVQLTQRRPALDTRPLKHPPFGYPQNGECCWSHTSPSATPEEL